KLDFDYLLNENHSLRFGAQAVNHQFVVSRANFNSDDGRVDFSSGDNFNANEFGLYINDDINVSTRWRVNTGLRISGFENDGQWYYGLEPRIAARYKAANNLSLKASFAQMYQYVQLITNSAAALPTDIWYPSNEVLEPQLSQQVSAGASILLGDGKYLLSNEYYYKWMQNQVDLRDGAQIFINDNLDEEFVFGRGWSYGTEVYLEKKEGRTTGWIGYTLSWARRQFADSSNNNGPINNGEAFFPRYDRRHDISLVIIHQINDKWTVSGNFVYGTGNAVSLPTNRFLFQNIPGAEPITGTQYLERNGYRMPEYHRADLNLIRKFKPRWGESELAISIYNVYNRRNAYLIYFDEIVNEATEETVRFEAKQVALFPILPAITWNFKF
ncbi:MAG: TonB-dependent receptor, partial [Bacteroidota bacterium]